MYEFGKGIFKARLQNMEFALIMIEILLEKVKAIKVTNISNTVLKL